ncbi:MAG TPA: polysaccharide deacetylase family protein [Candidatus Binatia bacterium]|nr:polysaccharide deacetylase family protein [Candidatus Binatia bacterium]
MRPRAAVFVFHDVVAPERLADVPLAHRPYALAPDELRAFLLAARTSSRRAVVAGQVPQELGGFFYSLTFDDGHASNYAEAFPVLAELGLRATFFVVPTFVDTPNHVTWAQLREMTAAGMEIGSHSLTHPFLDRLDRAALRREFGESKAIIEDRLGIAVRVASLPRGWPTPILEPVLEELGYRAFCTSRAGWWHPGDRALAIPRVAATRGMPIEDFAAIANAEARALWRLQMVDTMKGAVKACVGRRGWRVLRNPLLRLRYSEESR